MSQYIAVADTLMDIEYELRRLNLWQGEPPSAEALASSMPFCVDTLEFHQWLQFILLPKMYKLVEERGELPPACNVTAIAEETYKNDLPRMRSLLLILAQFDGVITGEIQPDYKIQVNAK